jgi:hypothetical protein
VSKQSIDDDDDLDPDEIVRASRDDHTAGDTSPGMTLMLLVMAHMPDDIAIGELFELLDEVVALAGGSIEKAIADLEAGRMVIRNRE